MPVPSKVTSAMTLLMLSIEVNGGALVSPAVFDTALGSGSTQTMQEVTHTALYILYYLVLVDRGQIIQIDRARNIILSIQDLQKLGTLLQ